jgi:hypothetical protein
MRKSAIPYVALSVHCLLKSDSSLLILSTGWTFQLVRRRPTLKAVAFVAERTPTRTKVPTVTPFTAKWRSLEQMRVYMQIVTHCAYQSRDYQEYY